MAIPFTLSGVAFTQPMAGPFKVGSAYYIVARDSTSANILKVLKATDPSSSWTEQDSAGHPTSGNKLAIRATVVGTSIHIVTIVPTYVPTYHLFDASSDTWSVVDESVGASSASNAVEALGIGVRSDGDVVVMYAGVIESIMGTNYRRTYIARRESGTWTADIRVDNVGKTSYHIDPWAAIMADQTNDRFHAGWINGSGSACYVSTYLSGNTFGQQDAVVDSAMTASGYAAMVDAVAFTAAANRRVRFSYIDASGKISIAGWNDADAPSVSAVVTGINDNDTADSFAFAVSGATQYYLYSVGTAVYYSKTAAGTDTWATDSTELSSAGGTVWACQVYDRSGSKLAYIYSDGANRKYGEKSLSSDVTVALSGQSETASAGSLAPSLSKALTGEAATYAQGSVSPGRFAALTGDAATFSAGTVGVSTAVALAGSAATYAAGMVAPSLSVALTGESASYAQGVLNVAIVVPLSGEQAAYATGTLSPALSVALSGEAVTYSTGTVTPATGITVPLTGEQAAYATGTFGVSFEIALSGEQAAYATGTVTPSVGITIALSGEAASYAAGNVGPETSVSLSGEAAGVTAGFLVPGTAIVLTGQEIDVQWGNIAAQLDVALSGAQITYSAGSLSVEAAEEAAPTTGGWIDPRAARALLRKAQAHQRAIEKREKDDEEKRKRRLAELRETMERAYAEITGEALPETAELLERLDQPQPEAPNTAVADAIAVYMAVADLNDAGAMRAALEALDTAIMRMRAEMAERDDEEVLLLLA